MPLIKAYCPHSCGPCTDQQRACGPTRKETEQGAADSPALMRRSNVCVPDQGDVANMLDSHDADENT
jgi:hypothetical protein